MTVVVDTGILIDVLRGRVEARDLLKRRASSGHRLLGSVVTRTELLAGVRRGEEDRTSALMRTIEWVPVDAALADYAGQLAQRLVRSHRGIGASDYLIAATTIWFSAELLTLNVKHFPMFTGLTAPY